MLVNQLNYRYIPFKGNENITSQKNEQKGNINQSEFCSKEAANGLKAKNINLTYKIPELGRIPDSILQQCQTGEKGQIIDKKTGKNINVTGEIRNGLYGYKVLELYNGSENIGYATIKKVDKQHPALIGTDKYMGDTGCIYIEYMQNNDKNRYKHVGTLLHRLIHQISKEIGCEGKVILDSMDKPASFHYDSGFRPLIGYNANDNFLKYRAKVAELEIINNMFSGSCNMYLPLENMKKLEDGEHCTPKEIKNLSTSEVYDLSEKYRSEFLK